MEKPKQTMNTANPVVQGAVDKLNEQKAELVQKEAIRLVSCIENEQAKIKGLELNIEDHREALAEIANTVVTEVSVLGERLPSNENRDTIAAVIAKANKDKQYQIEQSSGALTRAIVSDQDAIVLINKRIVELREALLKLTVSTVSVSQIAG